MAHVPDILDILTLCHVCNKCALSLFIGLTLLIPFTYRIFIYNLYCQNY